MCRLQDVLNKPPSEREAIVSPLEFSFHVWDMAYLWGCTATENPAKAGVLLAQASVGFALGYYDPWWRRGQRP